jgi:hypothetical protein
LTADATSKATLPANPRRQPTNASTAQSNDRYL